ncbi:ABC transporter ATP-binding protein [Nannocystis pusilla]|uniref:ABC transporter ATP-binding protein n=1 Tax=Nannocystis pusilla TaxID=889268 RepID=UPI003BEF629E
MTASGLVELRDVAVGYAESPVLTGIDLRIDAGEIVCIIGASGSGKSTLLRAMVGLLEPAAGAVHLFGQDLYAMRRRSRGRVLSRVGVLFQNDALFSSMSVLDNVMFPGRKLTDLPDEVIHELALIELARLGVDALAERMPQEISGGQAKRVALARANVLAPELIFCDEPTASLDPINAAVLGRELMRLRDDQGSAVVLVTHNMEVVRTLSDRTVVIAAGGIRAAGTASALERSEDPQVKALFRMEPVPRGPGVE